MADVFKSSIATIAQDSHLQPRLGLHNHRQIDPSIVVDIDRRQTPSALYICQWKRHTLKGASDMLRIRDVAPESDAGRTGVCHGNIHPAIFVEVKNGDASS